MTKLFLVSTALSAALFAGEIEFGSGTMSFDGGFVGLQGSIDADIQSYTLKQEHKDIASSRYFYAYKVTWYDSDKMLQAQSQIDSTLNTLPAGSTLTAIEHRLQGLDADLSLGYDLYKRNENNYFAGGLLVGISIPWIDSQQSDNDNDTTPDVSIDDTNTDIMTMKIGPVLKGSVSLNKHIMAYASATLAYQFGYIKNDSLDVDLNVNGLFQEYEAGIKIQPLSVDKRITSWLTLSPRLYFTLGYRYSNWKYNDVSIDLSGTGLQSGNTDMTIDASVGYFGIGYAFF